MSTTRLRIVITVSVMLANMCLLPAASREVRAQTLQPKVRSGQSDSSDRDSSIDLHDDVQGFVVRHAEGQAVCADASQDEARLLSLRDPGLELRQISPDHESGITPQLKIILRATQQLEAAPEARAAFLRAAANWEAIIRSPITIVIDVDFGPNRFGQAFPDPTILASTTPQRVGNLSIYPSVRARLIGGASSEEELALYAKLPSQLVPTDLGGTAGVITPSAVFRTLGFLNPVADPNAETQLGPAPSIGFNSAFSFDF